MTFIEDDGGRADAGFVGTTRDCGVRAAAIATGIPYADVYAAINRIAETERPRRGRRSDARLGVWPQTLGTFLEEHGFGWTPTMHIGSGCTTHLRADELPGGRVVARCSKHFVAVIDGVIHDTHDPSREGTRCVYGYWSRGGE